MKYLKNDLEGGVKVKGKYPVWGGGYGGRPSKIVKWVDFTGIHYGDWIYLPDGTKRKASGIHIRYQPVNYRHPVRLNRRELTKFINSYGKLKFLQPIEKSPLIRVKLYGDSLSTEVEAFTQIDAMRELYLHIEKAMYNRCLRIEREKVFQQS